MMWPMTTVVVTGGAGFIGSHVCDRLLAEGRRVVAVDDLSAGHIGNLTEARGYGKAFTFHNLDVRAEGLARILRPIEPEVVIHLASRREDHARLHPVGGAGGGVMGLLNVLEACAAVPAPQGGMVGPSSRFRGPPRGLRRQT